MSDTEDQIEDQVEYQIVDQVNDPIEDKFMIRLMIIREPWRSFRIRKPVDRLEVNSNNRFYLIYNLESDLRILMTLMKL